MSLNIPLIDAEELLRAIKSFRDDENVLPDTNEFPVYRVWLDFALGAFWRSEWWSGLMLGEVRYFRLNWLAASTYNKRNEVYDAATQKYFQCLRNSVTGAGQSPTTGGTEQSAYWAECRTAYSGADWSSSSVSYAVGTIVRYLNDNQYYQCHTAHTSSGTLTPDATAGNERWGLLTPFDRYIAFAQSGQTVIGDVFDVKSDNPKVNRRWRGVEWDMSENGVQVFDASTKVFVQFRRSRPRLKGNLFDATKTYAVGDQVYWDNGATIIGNFYDCIVATTAGQSPTSTAASWSKVEIPLFFQQHLAFACSAQAMQADDRDGAAGVMLGMADLAANLEADVPYRQQGLAPNQSPRTYASKFR